MGYYSEESDGITQNTRPGELWDSGEFWLYSAFEADKISLCSAEMRFTFFILFLMFALCGRSQYTPPDYEMPATQNSVGVNLTPAVVVAMGGFPFRTKYSLIYKRQFAINSAWRITANRELILQFEEQLAEGTVIEFSDSTITYEMERVFHHGYDLRLGLEWFKPRPNSMVYGVDLIAGIRIEDEGYRTKPYALVDEVFVPSPFIPETVYSQEVTYLMTGFDFSIGQKLSASDKLNFVIRWTPEFAYLIPIKESYSDITQRDTAAQSQIVFHLRGIEVYAHYRF